MSKRGHRKPKRRNYKIRGYQLVKTNRYDPLNDKNLQLQLQGEGPFEDWFNKAAQDVGNFVNDAASKIKNEFTNPDSLLNQAAKKIENELGKVFDPQKNGLKDKFEDFSRQVGPVFAQLGEKLANDLDPNKNGVKAAFDKFGADVNGAFNEIGNKIKEQAARDKAALDSAFAGIGDALANSIGNKDWWEKTMTDPETYFFLAGALLQAAGSMLGPVGLAAANGVLGATRMIVKAAKGEQVNLSDVMDMVVSMVPGGGAAAKAGTTAAKSAAKVTTSAANSAKSLLDATITKAKASIPPPGAGRAKKLGEQLVGMTQTAENMGIVPPLVAGTTPPTGTTDYKAKLQEAIAKRDSAGIRADALPAPTGSEVTVETVEQFSMDVDDRIYYEGEWDAYNKKAGDARLEVPDDVYANKNDPVEKLSAYFAFIDENMSLKERFDATYKRLAESGNAWFETPEQPFTVEKLDKFDEDVATIDQSTEKFNTLYKRFEDLRIGQQDWVPVRQEKLPPYEEEVLKKFEEEIVKYEELALLKKESEDRFNEIYKLYAENRMDLIFPYPEGVEGMIPWSVEVLDKFEQDVKSMLQTQANQSQSRIDVEAKRKALEEFANENRIPALSWFVYKQDSNSDDTINTFKKRLDTIMKSRQNSSENKGYVLKNEDDVNEVDNFVKGSEANQEVRDLRLDLGFPPDAPISDIPKVTQYLKSVKRYRDEVIPKAVQYNVPHAKHDTLVDEVVGIPTLPIMLETVESEIDRNSQRGAPTAAASNRTGTQKILDDALPETERHREFYAAFRVMPETFLNASNSERWDIADGVQGMPVSPNQIEGPARSVIAQEGWNTNVAPENQNANQQQQAPPEAQPTAQRDPDLAPNAQTMEDLGIDPNVQGRGMPRFKRRKLNRC